MFMNEPSLSVTDKLRNQFGRLRERIRRMFPFASGVLAALLALFLYNAFFPGSKPLTQKEVSTAISSAMASATPRPPFSEHVYEIIQPSLLLIEAELPGENGDTNTGLGSGVIINRFGDILTSLHVVANAKNIQVTFVDGTRSRARMVSSQPEKDIAVLQAETLPQLFVPAILGNANAMKVGDDSSMSAGVISGFDRSFQPPNTNKLIQGLIQVDAAINPGNSGGPLLNRYGEVVGIVTGIVNPTEQTFFIGIGFAVPIDVAAGGAGLPPY
jgi:S1-C subfamily serine protease